MVQIFIRFCDVTDLKQIKLLRRRKSEEEDSLLLKRSFQDLLFVVWGNKRIKTLQSDYLGQRGQKVE